MKTNRLNLYPFLKFLKSTDFSKGVLLAVAAIVPLVIFYELGNISYGISIAVGALVSSPSDVPGSFKRRKFGIIISVVMAVLATLLTSFSKGNLLLFLPILAVLIFGFSMISVYGFRASLVSFSGLFAIVLSLANLVSQTSVLLHVALIGAGGLWYLLLVMASHYINQKRQTEALLGEIFELTAEYLEVRGVLLLENRIREQERLKKKLLTLQVSLNEKHELIREILITKRLSSGRSGAAQKRLLIFMELIDILELSMAHPVNQEGMERLLKEHRQKMEVLMKWNSAMAKRLRQMGMVFLYNNPLPRDPELQDLSNRTRKSVLDLQGETSPNDELMLIFSGNYHFKLNQFQKILTLERLINNLEGKSSSMLKSKEAFQFLPNQDYDLKTLQTNLDFQSPIFRHSLRLTVVVIIGYLMGAFLDLQNANWILLTSLVIMRPGYALTKERFKQRLYGTLIGGVIAASIIFLTQNFIAYGILAVVTLILAFSMIQKNYKAAAAFITLNIVFVYSLLTPNAFEVIQFRVLDTFIGAALAFLGNALLWPTWEYKGLKSFMSGSISANLDYLREIVSLYQNRKTDTTSYKLARKEAFLAIGNLNAAFQRMAQEPKPKQMGLPGIFELVSLNQELLSSLASMGTFIRTHETTQPSVHFKTIISAIENNMENSLHGLKEEDHDTFEEVEKLKEAQSYFKNKIGNLLDLKELDYNQDLHREEVQEAQLIMDQLKWLLEISGNIRELILKTPWK